jgi:Domain of unknown function (DUF4747)
MPELIERFGMVDVTIIPSSEALETIFSMEGLAKLRIHVARPNPDDNYLTHTAVLERLRRQHAQSMDIEYSKERSADKLEPDQETRALAEIAATNGFVNGDGKGPNNEPRHESTKGHPMVEPIVIKDSMDPFEQLIAFAMSRRL